MLLISDTPLTTDILFTWHERLPVVAHVLLGSLDLFALYQFVASDQNSILAKHSVRQSLRSRLIIGLAVVGTILLLALILLLSERSAYRCRDQGPNIRYSLNSICHRGGTVLGIETHGQQA